MPKPREIAITFQEYLRINEMLNKRWSKKHHTAQYWFLAGVRAERQTQQLEPALEICQMVGRSILDLCQEETSKRPSGSSESSPSSSSS